MNYDEAKKAGAHRYEGKPCSHGHGGIRHVGSRKCVTCEYLAGVRRRDAEATGPGYIVRRAERIAVVTAALASVPLTTPELSERLKISEHALRRLLAALVAENVIHVCTWARLGGIPCRMFALGEGPNAPRPVKLTQKQMQQRWRDSRPKRTNQPAQRDPLMAALFGGPTKTEQTA